MADLLPEELLPQDDPVSPEDDLKAAVDSALDESEADPPEEQPPIPFGVSWAFDWTANPPRFKRHGGAPAEVRGLDALREWLEMSRRVARGAHPVFSPDFGMDGPEDWMSEVDVVEAASDYGAKLVDAWVNSTHERVVAVEDFDAHFEDDAETIFIDSLNVYTDNDQRIGLGDTPAPLYPD